MRASELVRVRIRRFGLWPTRVCDEVHVDEAGPVARADFFELGTLWTPEFRWVGTPPCRDAVYGRLFEGSVALLLL